MNHVESKPFASGPLCFFLLVTFWKIRKKVIDWFHYILWLKEQLLAHLLQLPLEQWQQIKEYTYHPWSGTNHLRLQYKLVTSSKNYLGTWKWWCSKQKTCEFSSEYASGGLVGASRSVSAIPWRKDSACAEKTGEKHMTCGFDFLICDSLRDVKHRILAIQICVYIDKKKG